MARVFNGKQAFSSSKSKGAILAERSFDARSQASAATTSASTGVIYRVRPVKGARTQVVVYYSTSGKKSYREPVSTRNNLERFIGIWSDLSEEDEKLFNEIFAERKTHFDRSLLDYFDE